MNSTPLNILLDNMDQSFRSRPNTSYMLNYLIESDASASSSHWFHESTASVLSLEIVDLYESITSSEFLYQVLMRSETAIVNLLRGNLSLLCNKTQSGQTSFHLAIGWPKGLAILMGNSWETTQSIINIEDRDGFTALEYAILQRDTDSVCLLLEFGAGIPDTTFHYINHFPVLNAPPANWARKEQIMSVIVANLAVQRRKLLDIALLSLGAEDIDRLKLRQGLPDHQAFTIAEMLRQQRIQLPAFCNMLEQGSVYHWPGIDHIWAQKLFDIGFDPANTDVCGYTPLMICYYGSSGIISSLNLVAWFEEHGVDIYASIPLPKGYITAPGTEQMTSGHSTVQMVSYEMGCSISPNRVCPDLTGGHISLFSRLSMDKSTDPCLCYCTQGGCTFISKYARGLSHEYPRGNFERVLEGIKLAEKAIGGDKHGEILGIIRVLTFETLQMRHTCCTYVTCWSLKKALEDGILDLMDPAEIKEIREEDRYLAQRLEGLMEEFKTKLQGTKMPLSDFMKRYWWPRMCEVEKERDELSLSDLQKIREIGVILDKS
ncbi:hypothetical protein M426DRAFT_110244 [Hypoxylon sp. CI-4A]|nr:hypothetical protein M426DRAFT_110244 [Hypoxylon sp. CI-4A]